MGCDEQFGLALNTTAGESAIGGHIVAFATPVAMCCDLVQWHQRRSQHEACPLSTKQRSPWVARRDEPYATTSKRSKPTSRNVAVGGRPNRSRLGWRRSK